MGDSMTVKIKAVRDGNHPAMPIIDILTADGETVQFEVSRRSIVGGRIGIGWPVGRRDDGALLVEFRTQYGCLSGGKHFGAHRIYVPADSLRRTEEYRDISSAPRDGTLVEVTDHETCTAFMRWNKAGSNWLVSEQPGIWEAPDGSFTWCEDQGFGPTHWRPAPAETTGKGGGDGEG